MKKIYSAMLIFVFLFLAICGWIIVETYARHTWGKNEICSGAAKWDNWKGTCFFGFRDYSEEQERAVDAAASTVNYRLIAEYYANFVIGDYKEYRLKFQDITTYMDEHVVHFRGMKKDFIVYVENDKVLLAHVGFGTSGEMGTTGEIGCDLRHGVRWNKELRACLHPAYEKYGEPITALRDTIHISHIFSVEQDGDKYLLYHSNYFTSDHNVYVATIENGVYKGRERFSGGITYPWSGDQKYHVGG